MIVTLTGASGFIGIPLVRRLLERGHGVRVLGRSRKESLPPEARFFDWPDIAQQPPVESVEDADAVIHLLGEPVAQRWNDEVKRRILESRVLGTRHLMAAIAKASRRPGALISASATGYYGDRGDEVLTEESAPASDFLGSVCVEWEKEAKKGHQLGLRVAQLRTGVVLGVEGGALKTMLPAFKMGAGAKLGSGEQWMAWIHLADLIESYVFVLESSKASGPWNATAPNPVRNGEFTDELAAALHRPAFVTAPEFALKLAVGEMAQVMLASQRVMPRVAEQTGFSFRFPRIKMAFADLFS